ncbi:prolyl oligopeptidase family serine peptidase [Chitinophaga filiformis]|uniref:alpha/beta hydrolase family protein n=1 Tax=Chitinophaga filiformis TaxID=104663 RepID=UPI001F1CBF41|nr:prolyl oligopeptidase family serine peptidase [Chitinophaga filiformis]MCF6401237.1 prolyl oligopeptidase family serine peptidase [Chitinophaga filiformis]
MDALENWTMLKAYNISGNGKYVWYSYANQKKGYELVLESLDNKWQMTFKNMSTGQFTRDCKYFIFYTDTSVGVLDLKSRKSFHIIGAREFSTPKLGNGRWICCKTEKGFILCDVRTQIKRAYDGATDFQFNNMGTAALVNTGGYLKWIDLQSAVEKVLDNGSDDIRYSSFDNSGEKCCFLKLRNGIYEVFYYHDKRMDKAELLISSDMLGLDSTLRISGKDAPFFNKNGKRIFLKLEQQVLLERDTTVIAPNLNIWSYSDRYLQSNQKYHSDGENTRRFTAVFDIGEKKLLRLEDADFSLVGTTGDNYVIVKRNTNEGEAYWAPEEFPSYKLISLSNGTVITCTKAASKSVNVMLSPNERFVLSYDTLSKHYYSYEISTGILRNITGEFNVPQAAYENGRPMHFQYNFEGWFADGNYLLIQDRFDLWQVDMSGKNRAIALTGGYGRTNGVAMRIAVSKAQLLNMRNNDSVVVTALVDSSKYNGFIKVKLGKINAIEKLKSEPYIYYFPGIFSEQPNLPIKADMVEFYVLQRQSDTTAPNIFVTYDFRQFDQISHLAPHRSWNWLVAELVHWRNYDGNPRMGLLYKPENFDSKKKYPIIFHYYQIRSNERFKFLSPSMSCGDLNIPWYVSNGYLIFVPDIHQHTAYTGRSALNSVCSAVDHLITHYECIDTAHMGLQGHSFGGYETNFIITHSSRFAAAQSSSGQSDLISSYGGLGFGDESLAPMTEVGQLNMGNTPWMQPQTYIENSPIFNAHKVVTPLLLMHNNFDGVVPMSQSIEFFTILRRLKKKVWLLAYDNNGHTLEIGSPESLDFSIRQKQFFDYYLKGEGAPIWMTRGMPFSLKGKRSGFQLEYLNYKP